MPSKPKRPGLKISDPELKRELEGKDVDRLIQEGAKRREARRGPGRPPGRSTRRYGISIPLDLADWLDATGSPSATIVRALRLLRAQEERRKRARR